jgi:hypothetical protein
LPWNLRPRIDDICRGIAASDAISTWTLHLVCRFHAKMAFSTTVGIQMAFVPLVAEVTIVLQV